MSVSVAIIDYQSGNLRSCAKAFEFVAAEAESPATTVTVTSDPAILDSATHIVLPGQGAFGDCRRNLDAISGMTDALTRNVIETSKPFFGICVGMQLLADTGTEHGTHDGLGWIGGTVDALEPSDPALKIPQMGWNDLQFDAGATDHPVLQNLPADPHAYFVHSFGFRVADPAQRLASVEYGSAVTAIVGRDNIIGAQFHPEKSQAFGLAMIRNFLSWKP